MSEQCKTCGGKKWINPTGKDGGPCPACTHPDVFLSVALAQQAETPQVEKAKGNTPRVV